MPKYITCVTRVLLNARRILMSSCPGEPALYDTHCQFCGYWAENLPEETEGGASSEEEPEEDDDDEISEQQSCPSDHWSERENLSEQGCDEDDEEEVQ